ncbi:hypothetical protein UFOVP1246_64 [uncultured Caudovirales phage]|uniref:Uncharacterized protein n=1 Tax=uncultured Caudovirales phage TaxID=2100421 RepID=A0A6J5RHV3_9CAUD|nr:hypothetical protein UFOVP1246_64 [uncultured Caudovirales phage]
MSEKQFAFGSARQELVDDDFVDADVQPVRTGSVLDALKIEVGRKVRRDSVSLEVPERANMHIQFSPNITSEQLAEWRKRATIKRTDTLNGNYFSALILANTCESILFDGEVVRDDSGNEVTFRSEEMLAATGTTKAVECVRAIYGIDPHVEAAAFKVLEAAGWGEEVEDSENPTKL